MNNDFQDFEPFGADVPQRPSRYFSALTTVVCGFIGSVLLLVGCFFLQLYTGFAPLSFVVWFIFPLGAILIGAIASVAYFVPARVLQYRPTARVVALILLAQVGAFFVGRYLEYVHFRLQLSSVLVARDENGVVIPLPLPSFIQYYRYGVEQSEWTQLDKRGKQEQQPYTLGLWGWGIELLALAAFVLTGLIGPGCLASYAYCDDCQRFMKTARAVSYPIRVPFPSLKKNDLAGQQAYQETDTAVLGDAATYLKNLAAFLETEPCPPSTAVADWLTENPWPHVCEKKQQVKVPNNMKITLSECSLCDNYQLLVATAQTLNIPNAKTIAVLELLRFHKGAFVTNGVEVFEDIGKAIHA